MTKKEIRNKYKQMRSQLSTAERDKRSLEIANQLLKMPIWNFETYHIFLSIEHLNEVNTEYILSILYGKEKNVVLPKVDAKSNSLIHVLLTEQTILKKNNWGIVEPTNGIQMLPSQIDVVFVPLLAYDRNGNRVGYGGGFYDRFLADCSSGTLKIGLSFFPPEDEIQEVFATDVLLDYCVTPLEIISFNS